MTADKDEQRLGDCPLGANGQHLYVATDESGNESVCDWCSARVTK